MFSTRSYSIGVFDQVILNRCFRPGHTQSGFSTRSYSIGVFDQVILNRCFRPGHTQLGFSTRSYSIGVFDQVILNRCFRPGHTQNSLLSKRIEISLVASLDTIFSKLDDLKVLRRSPDLFNNVTMSRLTTAYG